MKILCAALCAFGLVACASSASKTHSASGLSDSDRTQLQRALAEQDDAMKARYAYRNPEQTLTFFGIKPGMTVVEWLPGQGWYSRILVSYLGPDGLLVGADYPIGIWPNFPFATADFVEQRRQWPTSWPQEAVQWATAGSRVAAFNMDNPPEQLQGQADAVLFIRALHNLLRFDAQHGYLGQALAITHDLLKPGGVVGVVQHKAPENHSDAWADGSRGYIKQSTLVRAFEQAGFEFVGESPVNLNAKDKPGEDDNVWRLPPTLAGAQDNPAIAEQNRAIGESTRMTLLFRKPL